MALRTERLLALLQTLRERRVPVTAAALAERFGVSERTVYRDLDTLTGLGAPIRGEPGVGFVLRAGFFLPPLSLTSVEADAVLLGLRFVVRRGDDELSEAAGAALSKIVAGLPNDAERAMRLNGLAVGPSGGEPERVGAVRQAMSQEHKLRVAYSDRNGSESERCVWPVALGFFGDVEVLVAWCEHRAAFRHFRLDRIASLEPLPERLPVPRHVLLSEYRSLEPEADL